MSQNDARGVLYDLFVAKDVMSSERMTRSTKYADNWNLSLVGISDPTHPIQTVMGCQMDGNSIRFSRNTAVNSWRWSLNPVNPWTLITIQMQMGGSTTSGDMPAIQGAWEFNHSPLRFVPTNFTG